MAELAMLADIHRTIHLEEVTRQLHIMAQGIESSPVIDQRSNQLCYAANIIIGAVMLCGWRVNAGMARAGKACLIIVKRMSILGL